MPGDFDNTTLNKSEPGLYQYQDQRVGQFSMTCSGRNIINHMLTPNNILTVNQSLTYKANEFIELT